MRWLICLTVLLLSSGIAWADQPTTRPATGPATRPATDRAGQISRATAEELETALADERLAQAFYAEVMARFGPRRPFSNIIKAEQRHEAMLLELFERYDVPVPPREEQIPDEDIPAVPDTFAEAAAMAVESELKNIEMYDRLLKVTKEPDIRRVFTRLQAASRENHLPAFRRHARNRR